MTYGEKVLSRILTPGMLLLAVGAAMVYGSSFIAGKVAKGQEKVNLLVKGAGCVVALVGAVIMFA